MNTRYHIAETATGTGGFGRIDKAKDTLLERTVAIKMLDPLFKESPSTEDKERFKREAKTLATLSHPNIPAIYDVLFPETSGEFKLIFEWISGQTMREFLDEKGVMSLEQIKKWFANICSALTHAHQQGIIHRDIKPANLIITPNQESCYLVDFGIALRQSDWQRLTPSNYPIGTPGYMSPQQQKGLDTDASDDVYSLGIVLYECLSGHLPLVGEYQALNTLNEAIPSAIDDLILNCLREDKTLRLNSAKGFFQKLTEALQPHTTFKEILSRGSLSEIQALLSEIESQQYAKLKIGQRLFLMAKLKHIIKLDQVDMRNAITSLLSELIRVGHQSREKDYAYIIQQSLEYGYKKAYNGTTPTRAHQIRTALNQIALECQAPAHKILSKQTLVFIENFTQNQINKKEKLHDLTILLQNLLINDYCAEEYAERLGGYLEKMMDFND
jgi:serine/threonine protein kinase